MRADFHCHTCHSRDSNIKPADLVAACQQRGINCLAVTDHNCIRGALEVRALAPFLVIVGEEIRTTEGEIIGLFLEEEIPRGLTPAAVIRRIREQGGLVYLPHPLDRYRRSRLSDSSRDALRGSFDIVETLNARISLWADVARATELAADLGVPAAAGSDAHILREVGSAFVDIPDISGRNELLPALAQGQIGGHLSPPWVHVFSKANSWLRKIGNKDTRSRS